MTSIEVEAEIEVEVEAALNIAIEIENGVIVFNPYGPQCINQGDTVSFVPSSELEKEAKKGNFNVYLSVSSVAEKLDLTQSTELTFMKGQTTFQTLVSKVPHSAEDITDYLAVDNVGDDPTHSTGEIIVN